MSARLGKYVCGSSSHLARNCPKVSRGSQSTPQDQKFDDGRRSLESVGAKASYAEAVRGGKAIDVPPVVEPVPAEDLPSEPLDAAVGDMHSRAAECVPEVLAAEGEQEREVMEADGDGAGPSVEVPVQEEMDQSQDSLKQKIEGPLSPSQVIEDYPSEMDLLKEEIAGDSDESGQSYISAGKVESLQDVMGYCRPQKTKKKAVAQKSGARSGTRGRSRAGYKR